MFCSAASTIRRVRYLTTLIPITLIAISGCAGSRPVVLDPDRIPTEALLNRDASVEAVMLDGSTLAGKFSGASDSILLLERNRVAMAVPLDSVAYLNYRFPMAHTAKQRRLGFLRGLTFGIADAAVLTLIYSSADNDVNRSNLFWITAVTSAIPLTIYFTLESGNKGKELDAKAMADFTSEMMKVSRRQRPADRVAPADRIPDSERASFPLLPDTAVSDSLVLPAEVLPAAPGVEDTAASAPPEGGEPR